MAALGSLVVSLTAQTAQFTQAMDRAAYQSQRNFNQITSAAKTAGAAIGLALSGAAFVRSIKSQIDLADEIAKTSQKIGVQVEELQKLRFAASLSGLSADTLTRALSKISTEAVKGNDALKTLGVAVRDTSGNLKSSDQILVSVAEKISKYNDGVNKTAIVSEIFGEKIARELIPFLNLGAAGITELTKEAEKLGFVISKDTAQAAERFNDNLTRLSRATGGLFAKIAEQLLPTLESLTNYFIQLVKEGTLVQAISRGILTVFQTVAVVGSDVAFVFEQVGKALGTLAFAAKSVATGEFAAARAAFEQYSKEAEEGRKKLDNFQKTIMGLGQATASASPSIKGGKEDLEDFGGATDKVAAAIDRLRQEYKALFLTKGELAIVDLEMMGATKQQIDDAKALVEAIKQEADSRENAKEQLQAYNDLLGDYRKLYEDAATPAQKLADEEARLLELRERLIAAGYEQARVDDLIAEARMNAVDKFMGVKESVKDANKAALEFGDAFKSAFEDAIVSGKSLQDVVRGLAKDLLSVVLRQTVTKPLGDWVSAAVSSYFGGGKALGGPVTGGTSYLVGEQGPEIFTAPVGGGNIINNKEVSEMMGANQKAPEVNIRNINVLDPSLVGDYLGTADGERIILNVIQRNRGALA